MISKIKFISAYKILGIRLVQAICGYDGRLKITLKKPFYGCKLHIESRHITDIPGLVMIKPIIQTVIDLPKTTKKKKKIIYTDYFFNPIVPKGFSHVIISVKVTDKDDTVLEEKSLSLELVNEDFVKRRIRDDVILVTVVFTLLLSFISFLYK
jgi:hypothetical protein